MRSPNVEPVLEHIAKTRIGHLNTLLDMLADPPRFITRARFVGERTVWQALLTHMQHDADAGAAQEVMWRLRKEADERRIRKMQRLPSSPDLWPESDLADITQCDAQETAAAMVWSLIGDVVADATHHLLRHTLEEHDHA